MAEDALRILVIDDNRIRASVIEEGLLEAGYSHVTVITETETLMRCVVETDPDMIFIDLGNPCLSPLKLSHYCCSMREGMGWPGSDIRMRIV